MGCCLTTTAAVNHRHPPKPPIPTPPPPPPPPEEETVKEVLSETPIVPKPQQPPVPLTNRQLPNGRAENLTIEVEENVSEVSEMYSYSESFSAATTATTAADGKKEEIEVDDDGEVTQKVKNKSPPAKVVRKRPVGNSGEFPLRKERGTRPVARRPVAPSPERKRQSPSRTTINTPRYRNVGPANDGRREVTARRSRSPAVRGEMCQRRKVTEKSSAEKSDDMLPVAAVESEEKTEEGGVLPLPETEVQASESLENPLVSLECFIFL